MASLSKAAMLRIARKARARGYFQSGCPVKLWVNCPECGERVEAQEYTRDHSNGYRRRTTVQMLDAAMIAHLTDYCGEEE